MENKKEKPIEEKVVKKAVKNIAEKKVDIQLKANILKEVLKAVSVLGTETLFQIKPDKTKIEQVDEALVSMVSLELNSKACKYYKASTVDIGIDVSKLEEVLKLANNDDIVTLKYCNTLGNYICVSFDIIKSRKIGCLDQSTMARPKIPEIKSAISGQIDATHLNKGLKASSQIIDYVKLTANKDSLTLSTEDDTDSIDIVFDKDPNGLLKKFESNGKTETSLYSIDYVSHCLAVAKPDTEIKFTFGQNKPITISYDFEDGGVNVLYLVAPRIERDD